MIIHGTATACLPLRIVVSGATVGGGSYLKDDGNTEHKSLQPTFQNDRYNFAKSNQSPPPSHSYSKNLFDRTVWELGKNQVFFLGHLSLL